MMIKSVKSLSKKVWFRFFIMVFAMILVSCFMFGTTQSDEISWSFYDVSSAARGYLQESMAPDAVDDGNSALASLATVAVGDAGGYLGYYDEDASGGHSGWLSSALSNSSSNYDISMFDKAYYDNNGNYTATNVDLTNFYHFVRFGSLLKQVGFDDTATSLGGFGVVRTLAGGIVIIAYASAVSVNVAFSLLSQFLSMFNPFRWFVDGVNQVSGGLNYSLGDSLAGTAFEGIANTVSAYYAAFANMGWQVVVPFMFIVLLATLLLSKKADKMDKIKKYVIRIVFLGLGIPLLGSLYTTAIDSIANYDVSNMGAYRVVMSTFIDFESWANESRLDIPENAVFEIGSNGDPTSHMLLNLRDTCYNINQKILGGATNAISTSQVTDWNSSILAETADAGSSEYTAALSNSWSMLLRYMNDDFYNASAFETGVQGELGNTSIWTKDNAIKWVGQSDSIDDYKSDTSPVTDTSNLLFHNGGLTVTVTSSSSSTAYSYTSKNALTNWYKNAGLKPDKSGGLSTMAMYNYLTSSFGESNVTVYSSAKAASAATRETHHSVNLIGSGITSILYWLSCVTMLVAFGIIGWGYAVGILFNNIKTGFNMIFQVPFALLGGLRAISRVITYTIMLIFEIIATFFVYALVSDLLIVISDFVCGTFGNAIIFLFVAAGGEITVIVTLLVTIIFDILFIIMAMRMRKSVVKMTDEMMQRVIDRFIVGQDMPAPSDKPGLLSKAAGAAAAGAGMALGHKLMSGSGGNTNDPDADESGSAKDVATGENDGDDNTENNTENNDVDVDKDADSGGNGMSDDDGAAGGALSDDDADREVGSIDDLDDDANGESDNDTQDVDANEDGDSQEDSSESNDVVGADDSSDSDSNDGDGTSTSAAGTAAAGAAGAAATAAGAHGKSSHGAQGNKAVKPDAANKSAGSAKSDGNQNQNVADAKANLDKAEAEYAEALASNDQQAIDEAKANLDKAEAEYQKALAEANAGGNGGSDNIAVDDAKADLDNANAAVAQAEDAYQNALDSNDESAIQAAGEQLDEARETASQADANYKEAVADANVATAQKNAAQARSAYQSAVRNGNKQAQAAAKANMNAANSAVASAEAQKQQAVAGNKAVAAENAASHARAEYANATNSQQREAAQQKMDMADANAKQANAEYEEAKANAGIASAQQAAAEAQAKYQSATTQSEKQEAASAWRSANRAVEHAQGAYANAQANTNVARAERNLAQAKAASANASSSEKAGARDRVAVAKSAVAKANADRQTTSAKTRLDAANNAVARAEKAVKSSSGAAQVAAKARLETAKLAADSANRAFEKATGQSNVAAAQYNATSAKAEFREAMRGTDQNAIASASAKVDAAERSLNQMKASQPKVDLRHGVYGVAKSLGHTRTTQSKTNSSRNSGHGIDKTVAGLAGAAVLSRATGSGGQFMSGVSMGMAMGAQNKQTAGKNGQSGGSGNQARSRNTRTTGNMAPMTNVSAARLASDFNNRAHDVQKATEMLKQHQSSGTKLSNEDLNRIKQTQASYLETLSQMKATGQPIEIDGISYTSGQLENMIREQNTMIQKLQGD